MNRFVLAYPPDPPGPCSLRLPSQDRPSPELRHNFRKVSFSEKFFQNLPSQAPGSCRFWHIISRKISCKKDFLFLFPVVPLVFPCSCRTKASRTFLDGRISGLHPEEGLPKISLQDVHASLFCVGLQQLPSFLGEDILGPGDESLFPLFLIYSCNQYA